jgi:uncharacterized membrane protein
MYFEKERPYVMLVKPTLNSDFQFIQVNLQRMIFSVPLWFIIGYVFITVNTHNNQVILLLLYIYIYIYYFVVCTDVKKYITEFSEVYEMQTTSHQNCCFSQYIMNFIPHFLIQDS